MYILLFVTMKGVANEHEPEEAVIVETILIQEKDEVLAV